MNNEIATLINGSRIQEVMKPTAHSTNSVRLTTLHHEERCLNCGVSVYLSDEGMPLHATTDENWCEKDRSESNVLVAPSSFSALPEKTPLGWLSMAQTDLADRGDEAQVSFTCSTADGRYVILRMDRDSAGEISVSVETYSAENGTNSHDIDL